MLLSSEVSYYSFISAAFHASLTQHREKTAIGYVSALLL